jgi:hypothetical protein
MSSFLYQYGVMWLVFGWGVWIGLRNGQLSLRGEGAKRLALLVAGMIGMMTLQGLLTPWGTP